MVDSRRVGRSVGAHTTAAMASKRVLIWLWMAVANLTVWTHAQMAEVGGICTLQNAELPCVHGLRCTSDSNDSVFGTCNVPGENESQISTGEEEDTNDGTSASETPLNIAGLGEMCTIQSSEVACEIGLSCIPNQSSQSIGVCAEDEVSTEEDGDEISTPGGVIAGLGELCTLQSTEVDCEATLTCIPNSPGSMVGICTQNTGEEYEEGGPDERVSGAGEMCSLASDEVKCEFGLICMATTLSDTIGICESDEDTIINEGVIGSICTLDSQDLSCQPPYECTDNFALEGNNQGGNVVFGTCSEPTEAGLPESPTPSPHVVAEGNPCLLASLDTLCEEGLTCVPLLSSSSFGRCERTEQPQPEYRIDFYFTGEEPLFEGTTPKNALQSLINQCQDMEGCMFNFKASRSSSETIQMVGEELQGSESKHHVYLMGQQSYSIGSVLAKQHPNTLFTEVNAASSELVNNLESIVFREDQAGFLAGVYGCKLANHLEESPAIGIMGYMADVQVNKYVNGFWSGCMNTCQNCQIELFNTSSIHGSQNTRFEAFVEGIDMLFDGGSNTEGEGEAYLVRASQQGVLVIGAGDDVFVSLFRGGDARGSSNVVTSAKLDIAGPISASAATARSGGFSRGLKTIGISEGAVSLASCHLGCSRPGTPDAFNAATDAALALRTNAVSTDVDMLTGEMQSSQNLPPPDTSLSPPQEIPISSNPPVEVPPSTPGSSSDASLQELDTESNGSSSSLSGADIFGIVLASVVGVAILGVVFYVMWGRKGKQSAVVKASSFIEMERGSQDSFVNSRRLPAIRAGNASHFPSDHPDSY
eukprot:scaffold625_cov324-Pavlova_lutheri.AAC.39